MSDLPLRKQTRLPAYDYSLPGAYFVTICAQDRQNLFWNVRTRADLAVGADSIRPQEGEKPSVPLSALGEIVDGAIRNISERYPGAAVDAYVIMPNHVHLLLRLTGEDADGRMISAPTLSQIVGQMKRWATKQAGRALWQKSFHEHVVRGDADYREIWAYIDENPAKWAEDRYYSG